MTALTGDPDLFVSKKYYKPNATHSEWNSRAAGDDAIAIRNAKAGTYYLSVYGYLNTTFTITAYALGK